MKTTRLAAGVYEITIDGRTYSVWREVVPAEETGGYGRRDDWQVVDPDRNGWDPCPTLADAKAGIREDAAQHAAAMGR